MSLESEDFVAEVRTGNSFSDNKVLTSGTLRATGGPEIDGGQPIINIKTIEFDHPAYINPGEKFWVYIYIKPNTGIALMSVTDPATEGRFTVHLEGTWDDLLSLQSQYGVLGFLQKYMKRGQQRLVDNGRRRENLTTGRIREDFPACQCSFDQRRR